MKMFKNNKGFTLPEMLLVVAVMGILTTMAFPDLTQFFRLQRKNAEESKMTEIHKALEVYAEINLTLPPNPVSATDVSWATSLSEYTNLSTEEIVNDEWGNPRAYRMQTDTITYRDTAVDVAYAILLSGGDDRCLDEGNVFGETTGAANCTTLVDNLDVDADDIFGSTTADIVQAFEDTGAPLSTNRNDKIIKYTNVKIQTQNYKESVCRVKEIQLALEDYAQAVYNMELADFTSCRIYEEAAQRESARQGHSPVRYNYSGGGQTGCERWPQIDDNGMRMARSGGSGDGISTPSGVSLPSVGSNLVINTDINNIDASHFRRPPDRLIYYPRSRHSNGAGGSSASTISYYAFAIRNGTDSEMNRFFGSATYQIENAANNDTTRYSDMRGLMRMLGLPEEYCCSAHANTTVGGVQVGLPFFYYSNPMQPRQTAPTNRGAHCGQVAGTAPNGFAQDYTNGSGVFQKARVTMEEDVCG